LKNKNEDKGRCKKKEEDYDEDIINLTLGLLLEGHDTTNIVDSPYN